VLLLALLGAGACREPAPTTPPEAGGSPPPSMIDAAVVPLEGRDPIALLDELDAGIVAGRGDEDDRRRAYTKIGAWLDDGSVEYAYARAAITGRYAEVRGLRAGVLLTQTERWARTALERDPAFRDHAATRLLGTLYVLAPPRYLRNGDSEVGLELLEELHKAAPDNPHNKLRLAEAYLALGDPEPATPLLCALLLALPIRVPAWTAGDDKLLDKLVADAGGTVALGCGA
jgi:tetratricopeptide (TPR) repeat protein